MPPRLKHGAESHKGLTDRKACQVLTSSTDAAVKLLVLSFAPPPTKKAPVLKREYVALIICRTCQLLLPESEEEGRRAMGKSRFSVSHRPLSTNLLPLSSFATPLLSFVLFFSKNVSAPNQENTMVGVWLSILDGD
jgi:hypothetical protein